MLSVFSPGAIIAVSIFDLAFGIHLRDRSGTSAEALR